MFNTELKIYEVLLFSPGIVARNVHLAVCRNQLFLLQRTLIKNKEVATEKIPLQSSSF